MCEAGASVVSIPPSNGVSRRAEPLISGRRLYLESKVVDETRGLLGVVGPARGEGCSKEGGRPSGVPSGVDPEWVSDGISVTREIRHKAPRGVGGGDTTEELPVMGRDGKHLYFGGARTETLRWSDWPQGLGTDVAARPPTSGEDGRDTARAKATGGPSPEKGEVAGQSRMMPALKRTRPKGCSAIGEPDAGELPVRFDEGAMENEHCSWTGLRAIALLYRQSGSTGGCWNRGRATRQHPTLPESALARDNVRVPRHFAVRRAVLAGICRWTTEAGEGAYHTLHRTPRLSHCLGHRTGSNDQPGRPVAESVAEVVRMETGVRTAAGSVRDSLA